MKKLSSLLLVLMLCSWAFAGQHNYDYEFKIHFEQGKSIFNPNYKENQATINKIVSVVDSIKYNKAIELDLITIDGTSSPESGATLNKKLSQRRAESVAACLKERCNIPSEQIKALGKGVNWSQLRDMVAISSMKYRDDVIYIIDNTPEEVWQKNEGDKWATLVDSRLKHLMDLKGGEPYRYMAEHFFPDMRSSASLVISYQDIEKPQPVVKRDTIYIERKVSDLDASAGLGSVKKSLKPMFALKTNFLGDLAITPNLEIEVPIAQNWSVGVQGYYAKWIKSDNSFCWQIKSVDLEGKYWFRKNSDSQVMTGWFAGVYGTVGLFDMQLNEHHGKQSSFFAVGGLSGGYSIPLNRSLYLEFELGVGYTHAKTQDYLVLDSELYENGAPKCFRMLFPTKAEVSLGWLLFPPK